MKKRVLSLLVDNTSGVLSRVAGLFSRRGYNIDSLTVGETADPRYSRMTVVARGDEQILDQIVKQLAKLIDVVKIAGLRSKNSVYKELVLVKVNSSAEKRASIIELCDIFRTKIVDICIDSMIIELSGTPEKNEALLKLLDEYGIIEMSRTGITALQRGTCSLHEDD